VFLHLTSVISHLQMPWDEQEGSVQESAEHVDPTASHAKAALTAKLSTKTRAQLKRKLMQRQKKLAAKH
jgi:hypothetical protein